MSLWEPSQRSLSDTGEPRKSSENIFLNSSQNVKFLRKKNCRENQNTSFVFFQGYAVHKKCQTLYYPNNALNYMNCMLLKTH